MSYITKKWDAVSSERFFEFLRSQKLSKVGGTEALYGEKRQVVYSGFCTNMILSKISPAETATRT